MRFLHGPAPVHFGRRSTRGLLLGLSTARCVSGGAAIAAVVVGLVAGGGIGLVATGLLWVPLLGATFVTWQGVAVSEWIPVVGHWWARKIARQMRLPGQSVGAAPGGDDGPPR